MADPSALVPQGLLRHIHLISNYSFPKLPQYHLDTLVEYLIQAPRIVKEQASMNWMFLQCPQDGDVLLVWQPPQMGTHEASDGYVWADPESAFSSEMRGYKVEMYVHRSGFRAPNEPTATHARRRLRLTPSQNPDPNLPLPDSSLWIIHYCQSDPLIQYPSRNIRVSDQARHTMHERMQLQRYGQLVRKEFMLRDSASWPTINLPGNSNPSYSQQAMGYPNDVMAHMNRGQQQAYLQQQQANAAQRGVGPSPAKRPRHGGPVHGHGSTTAIPAPILSQTSANEDEDDTVGGDYMDHLTPRDISLHRYIQHHEWLEEILESPFDTNQIIPGELGLGRKGELESLTGDFFDAPVEGTRKELINLDIPLSEDSESRPPPLIGKLEAGQAEKFANRASEKVAQINSEMEKLRSQHVRRMAKLQKGRDLKEVEQSLRAETLAMINGDTSKLGVEQDKKVTEMAMNVVGKGIKAVQDVVCIQKGGLEEKSENRDSNDRDYDMVDTLTLEGNTQYQPSRAPIISATKESPLNDTNSTQLRDTHGQLNKPQDLSGEANYEIKRASTTEELKDPASEDWIMVNKVGNSAPEDKDLGELDSFGNDAAMQPSLGTLDVVNDPGDTPLHNLGEAVENPMGSAFGNGGEEDNGAQFETNDFAEGIDFGDLDAAGNELSGYTHGIEQPGFDEHIDMGANDSAFGDAFPVPEGDARNDASGT